MIIQECQGPDASPRFGEFYGGLRCSGEENFAYGCNIEYVALRCSLLPAIFNKPHSKKKSLFIQSVQGVR